jgi:hypothetical protein
MPWSNGHKAAASTSALRALHAERLLRVVETRQQRCCILDVQLGTGRGPGRECTIRAQGSRAARYQRITIKRHFQHLYLMAC